MFDILGNPSSIQQVIENGKIPFIVRGNIDCYLSADFSPFFGIRVFPPTTSLKVFKIDDDITKPIFVKELHEEAVFSGEIELPEKTPKGVSQALWALERWADFLCFVIGNPSLQVEVQPPMKVVITASGHKLSPDALERWRNLILYHHNLPDNGREIISRALWWHRKGCNAIRHSIFDGYSAYWNCFEILCGVSANKINKGTEVDKAIQEYLNSKKKIKAGHIAECYNRFVKYSVPNQMRDVLKPWLGEEQAERVVYFCFEISPSNDQLYQIRNDINHGNIKENDPHDYMRVNLHSTLLYHILTHLLYARLGRKLKPPLDVDDLWETISSILEK